MIWHTNESVNNTCTFGEKFVSSEENRIEGFVGVELNYRALAKNAEQS
jgi:hypothetical protein